MLDEHDRRRAVAEEAGADEHAGVVVEVEGGGADLDRDAGGDGVGVRGEHALGGAERRDGGAAAEADEVLEVGVGAQAELLGDIAGDARAEVAGAGADEQRVELVGAQAGLGEGAGEGAAGEERGLAAEGLVELVGGGGEHLVDGRVGEVARGHAAVAAQDGLEHETGAARQAFAGLGGGDDVPALALGVAGFGNGGGEGVEIHQWRAW